MTTTRLPRLHRATPAERGDFDDEKEPTVPGVDVVVSNAVLYRLLQRLGRRITWLAAGMVVMAASVVLLGLLIYWSRPR